MAFKRLVCSFVLIVFGLSGLETPPADAYDSVLPTHLLSLTPPFHPLLIQGMRVYPKDPLRFDFIMDTGDQSVDVHGPWFKQETTRLIKYFLASLTVPEQDMWVNLSPYEKNRIIAKGLGETQLGNDMLADDFILKRLTASLLYPDSQTGKAFWQKVYAKTQQKYGRTDIPVNTFNKVWIVPDKAVVYEHGNTVYVAESHLKVMLEEDYLSLRKHFAGNVSERTSPSTSNSVGSGILRQIVLPQLEKEVNEGHNFANLRQIYNSMILAVWFKLNLQESLLGQVYVNKDKTVGVDPMDKGFRRNIYEQYLRSFKKGIYNYIREENDPATGQVMPRKYFSGGLVGVTDVAMVHVPPKFLLDRSMKAREVVVESAMVGQKGDATAQKGKANNPAMLSPKDFVNQVRNQWLAPGARIVKSFAEAGVRKYLVRFKDQISADVSVGVSRPEVIVLLIKKFSTVFRLRAQGGVQWTVKRIEPVEKDHEKGIDMQLSADTPRIILGLRGIQMRGPIGTRDILYEDRDIPDWERTLAEYLLHFTPSQRDNVVNALRRINPRYDPQYFEKMLVPQIRVSRNVPNENGSIVTRIEVTKMSFFGDRYRLVLEFPPNMRVIEKPDSFVVTATNRFQKAHMRMVVTSDAEPLTAPDFNETYTKEALQRMEKNKTYKEIAEKFSLLLYEGKVLGGLWIYPAFFGRDTQYAFRFMDASWRSSNQIFHWLTNRAKTMIAQTILDRTSDEGFVAVNDETFDDHYFQTKVLDPFMEFLAKYGKNTTDSQKAGELYRLLMAALKEGKRGVLTFEVLDATLLAPGTLKRLDSLSPDEWKEFLHHVNARGEENQVTIARILDNIMRLLHSRTEVAQKLINSKGLHGTPDEIRQQLKGLLEFRSTPEFETGEFQDGEAEALVKFFSDSIPKAKQIINSIELETLLPGSRETAVAVLNKLLKDRRFMELLVPNLRRPLTVEAVRSILEEKYPDHVPQRLVTTLIRKLFGGVPAGWRDSFRGYGLAKRVLELAILGWADVGKIEDLVKRMQSAGVDVRELKYKAKDQEGHEIEKKFDLLTNYIHGENGIGFKEAEFAWSTALDHFKVHLSAEEVRIRFQKFFEKHYISKEKEEFYLQSNVGKDNNGEPVTLDEFVYEGKTPESLKKGISFTSVGLGVQIWSSELTLLLMEKTDLSPQLVHQTLNELFTPFPIGPWTPLGLLTARSVYSDNVEFNDQFNREDEYHGPHVFWSKVMGELTLGLILQIRNAQSQIENIDLHIRNSPALEVQKWQEEKEEWEKLLKRLKGHLKEVVKAEEEVGPLRSSEIWSWGVKKVTVRDRLVTKIKSIMIAVDYRQNRFVSEITFTNPNVFGPERGKEIFKWLQENKFIGDTEPDTNKAKVLVRRLSQKQEEALHKAFPDFRDEHGDYEWQEIQVILLAGQPSGNPQAWANFAWRSAPEWREAERAVKLESLAGPLKVLVHGLVPADAAMRSQAHAAANPGGIDLNPAMLNLKTRRDGGRMGFAPAAAEAQVSGFTPVILRILPMSSTALADSA